MYRAAAVAQLPYLVCYLALVSFAVAVIARCVMWASLPMHVRWELYPIPHEPPDKAPHGGSFMEDADWWSRPRKISLLGEAKAMIPEILLLSAVRAHNRQLWARTFPFHLGLYLAGVAVCLALLAGISSAVAPTLLVGAAREFVQRGVLVLGVAGLALGCIGSLLLLHRRLTEPALKAFTVPADIFNLLFFALAFSSGLLTFALVDRNADLAWAFAADLTSFNMVALPGTGIESILPTATVVLLSLLIAYIPLTHMSHFVGKFFAYHAIRWNDDPNLAGGPQEAQIKRQLAYKVSWAADHIRGQGEKTWVDVATVNPTEVKK
jgi:nitrate reductase gamma subunit